MIEKKFGHQLRVRACGICIDRDRILLAGHRGLTPGGLFWCPPGGGIMLGEPAEDAVKREFMEETGMQVNADRLLFVSEFIRPPLHAVELFFLVSAVESSLGTPAIIVRGTDPEMGGAEIIDSLQYMTMNEIKAYPAEQVHMLFQYCHTLEELLELKGLLTHNQRR